MLNLTCNVSMPRQKQEDQSLKDIQGPTVSLRPNYIIVFRMQGWVSSSSEDAEKTQKYWFFASWEGSPYHCFMAGGVNSTPLTLGWAMWRSPFVLCQPQLEQSKLVWFMVSQVLYSWQALLLWTRGEVNIVPAQPRSKEIGLGTIPSPSSHTHP